jgi:uncharacterized protein (DUF1330 family)
MPAYVISDLTTRDPEAFESYRTGAADSIRRHGGRYLVRGGEIEVVEGTWHPRMIVIVEFPSLEQAQAWYRSAEYGAALAVRDAALSRNLVFVDGVPASL